jgi:hypothetical protein
MEKSFKCRNGHTLGLIRWSGEGVPQLMVYRHAVSMEAERPAEVDVMGPMVGSMSVQCDLCGDVRWWAASSQAVAELVLRLSDGQMAEMMRLVIERSRG